MSELKAEYATDKDSVTSLYYPKSVVDKVLAELEAENEKLRGESCKLTDGCLRLKQCRKEKANIADELCHSNHKRCLAMAEWCEVTARWCYQAANTLPIGFRATLYGKPVMIEPSRLFNRSERLSNWVNRWRKLAEKFKEAK